jgi:hypothetical protein
MSKGNGKTNGSRQFDLQKDERLRTDRVESDGSGHIEVHVARYDGGPIKIGLARTYTTRDGEVRYSKLGRMTVAEAGRVVHVLKKILETKDGPGSGRAVLA